MVIITIDEMIRMYNEEGLSLRDIGEKIGKSKSSVQRTFNNNGWFYDKKSKKFLCKENNEEDFEPKIKKTTRDEQFFYTSFGIYNETYRALKIKCAMEDKKIVEVVNDALKSFIEEKYFNM